MKLVASMMVGPGEEDRYLVPCLEHLIEFCDLVTVRWEAPVGHMWESDVVEVLQANPTFFAHEGRARQELLAFTLRHEPTHILAIDADEFITDGQRLREIIEANEGANAFEVGVEEVWKADRDALWIREDGQWGNRRSPLCYKVPRNPRTLRIANRALASGREPIQIARDRHPVRTDVSLLHFGWTCEADRRDRFSRYETHDGGRFHRSAHLDSIMWDDSRVRLTAKPWPDALDPVKEAVGARANRVPEPEALTGVVDPPTEMRDVWAPTLEQLDGLIVADDPEWAFYRTALDGRWVGLTWDGEILSGRLP